MRPAAAPTVRTADARVRIKKRRLMFRSQNNVSEHGLARCVGALRDGTRCVSHPLPENSTDAKQSCTQEKNAGQTCSNIPVKNAGYTRHNSTRHNNATFQDNETFQDNTTCQNNATSQDDTTFGGNANTTLFMTETKSGQTFRNHATVQDDTTLQDKTTFEYHATRQMHGARGRGGARADTAVGPL